jgi:phosphatidate cytidylyltransferase
VSSDDQSGDPVNPQAAEPDASAQERQPADSRSSPRRDHGRLGRNLPAAVATGVVLAGAIVGSLIFSHVAFVAIIAALMVAATIELSINFGRRGIRVTTIPIAVGTACATVLPYLSGQLPAVNGGGRLSHTALLLAVLGLTGIVSLAWRLPSGADGFVADASASLFLLAYIPLLGSFVALLLRADQHGVARVVTFILAVVMSDLGGYVAGVAFGRHPMAPRISPKKSWEGMAGSVVFACAAAVLMAIFGLDTSWWVGLILGPALVAAGTVGDLVESLIKRDLGIKDMSNFLPGHGGVLDRIDSLLLAAPVAWLIMYLLVPGG